MMMGPGDGKNFNLEAMEAYNESNLRTQHLKVAPSIRYRDNESSNHLEIAFATENSGGELTHADVENDGQSTGNFQSKDNLQQAKPSLQKEPVTLLDNDNLVRGGNDSNLVQKRRSAIAPLQIDTLNVNDNFVAK